MSTSDKLKIFFPLQLGENNSILRKKSQKIEKITPEIREFGEILLELMREYDGVGLAAPQIGENIAMIATTQWKKVPQGKNADKDYLGETLLINPEIVDKSKEMQISEEACLSLPGKRGNVRRHERVIVKFQDLKGKTKKLKYSGFNACIIQHEIDHLKGVLFTDKLISE
ncbi:MAG: peptide deformylase [Candidatus Absconditicoccaceae bacterium]